VVRTGEKILFKCCTVSIGACHRQKKKSHNSTPEEESIHQWLLRPEHHAFLEPHQVRVWSKLAFGNKVSDFVVRRSDGTYSLIEIEPASAKVFTQRVGEPSAPFNHACQQVRDWQRYIRDNVHTVRSELGLEGIYEPVGMVVIGRDADIPSGEARTRWRDLKGTQPLVLLTFDDLIDRILALAASLKYMLHEIG